VAPKPYRPTKQRYIKETLADFREAGADLPPEQKKRAGEIQSQLAELTQKYSENCLDGTNAWEKIIIDEKQLSGLPKSALGAARQSAEQKGLEGWRFTLQAPSYIPIMTYADNNALRKEVWSAYAAIGRSGDHDNRQLVRQILDLRHEFAQLVGQENFANHVTKRRMAASGQAALDFGDEIFQKVRDQFEKEAEELRRFKAAKEGLPLDHSPLLEPWEVGYWAEKQRNANYAFDEEALRPYFQIDRVISGMYEIAQQIFGLRIEERDTSKVWHEEVKFYDLFDSETKEQLGSFYADWHPRESKRGGAWMNYFITGNRDPSVGERSPHLGLICGNLTPAVGDQPALLTHREVETIFHEFGHLLHHLCGDVEVKSLNGVNVPWDFVELPSQIMENWCWERESLDRIARHHETGDTIPQELFDKLIAARNYMKASANVRQLAFGQDGLRAPHPLAGLHPKKTSTPLLKTYSKTTMPNTRPKLRATSSISATFSVARQATLLATIATNGRRSSTPMPLRASRKKGFSTPRRAATSVPKYLLRVTPKTPPSFIRLHASCARPRRSLAQGRLDPIATLYLAVFIKRI
jgi:oligopeptidase A